jgi:SAM-dependent methyltransferase
VVAAYFPLFSIPRARILLDRAWPPAIEAILTQQICEPEEERELRRTIPQLTSIEDTVSRSVRAQYEENPYPRWVVAGAAGTAEDVTSYLRRTFPQSRILPVGRGASFDILVAGCGTGRNAVETTQKFKGARTLAIDLSLSSLAHAARKSHDAPQIEYAQADLLELGVLDRRFDLIEAVGVLHHLADPFAGWRALLSLLKPQGVMKVGLYSAYARRDLPQQRDGLSGAIPTAGDVRKVRQQLLCGDPDLALHPDFFTISTCRDLLFHVQEQSVPLDAIDDFLRRQNLTFLGFDLDASVLALYRERFADDPGARDLDHWQEFEAVNPDIFSGMYQFWLQKGPSLS